MSQCGSGSCDGCSGCSGSSPESLLAQPNKYSSVKKIIGVVSGKGGVGKSFVTALLASHMNKKGYKTGILDADITGPSIPMMFNVTKKAEGSKDGVFPNVSKKGIKIMSSQLLLEDESSPYVWRGPIIADLVTQFWTNVIWEDVDFLFVDMPPGTGDVPLTVYQSIGLDGIIVVSTPQDLVSMIVSKALNMANMMNVKVLGLIENMSFLKCPCCDKHNEIFGKSKVEEIARQYNLKVLGKLPINSEFAQLCDQGKVEDINLEELSSAIQELESQPLRAFSIAIGVTKDDMIARDMAESEFINIYTIVKKMIIACRRIKINNDYKDILNKYKISCIFCNKMDQDLIIKLENKGVMIYIQSTGQAINMVRKYIESKEGTPCDCSK